MTQNEWIGLFIVILVAIIILTVSMFLQYTENRNTSVPDAPTITTIVCGNNRLEIYFRAPSSNGGFPILAYEYSLDNGKTFIRVNNTNSPILVNSGVTNETTYPVILRAINALGKSPNSNVFNATPSDAMQIGITVTTIKTVSLPFSGITSLTVDWGDGSPLQTFTSGPISHTYASEGDYGIRVTGSATGFGISLSPPSRNVFKRFSQWGDLGLTSLANAFANFDNLTSVPNYLPSTVTNISAMFRSTAIFNDSNVANWNTQNITDMSSMFSGANNFNQDISNWDTSSVIDMRSMFNDARNFNQDISKWDTSSVTDMSSMFTTTPNFKYNLSNWNVANVTNAENIFCASLMLGWTQYYPNFPVSPSNYSCLTPLQFSPFRINISVTNPNSIMTLPFDGLSSGGLSIQWGDGSPIELFTTTPITHTYVNPGNYSIIIDQSTYPAAASFGNISGYVGADLITEIYDWGTFAIPSLEGAFYGAINLTQVPLAFTPYGQSININKMFYGATNFNQDISNWLVGNVTSAENIFCGAAILGQTAKYPNFPTPPSNYGC